MTAFDEELGKIRLAILELRTGKERKHRVENVMFLISEFGQWCREHLEEKKPDQKYLVWSEEHGAWWVAGKMGYTRYIEQAGRYSFKEATEIEAEANRVLDIDKGQFHEVVIRDPFPL